MIDQNLFLLFGIGRKQSKSILKKKGRIRNRYFGQHSVGAATLLAIYTVHFQTQPGLSKRTIKEEYIPEVVSVEDEAAFPADRTFA